MTTNESTSKASRQISIYSYMDDKTHNATFDVIRKASRAELGWATITDDDYELKFPIIVYQSKTKAGQTIYTVSDWQAPTSSFGDISNAYDWACLTHTGTGEFINCGRKNNSPINTKMFDLPLTVEEQASLAKWLTPTRPTVD